MNDIHRKGLVLPFPKTQTYILICLFAHIVGCYNVKAQDDKAIDITTKGIQIGQQVPDIRINYIHNYKTNSAKISDFKGKFLIIDFWATWCSPCVAMIPKMDTLQKQFGNKIQFLSVTYQSEKVALPFLSKLEQQQKKHYNLPIVFGDKKLHKLFPHTTLPHYVWINPDGVVKAITESKEIDSKNIVKMLLGNSQMAKKSDFKVAYDNNKPFLINGNGGDGSNLVYHSILTKFTEGIASTYSRTSLNSNSQGKVNSKNTSLLQIFRIAYGGYNKYYGLSRCILNVVDSTLLVSEKRGMEYLDWLKNGNGYCYELVVPPNLSLGMYEIMKKDLNNLFPDYTTKAEKRKVKCMVLKRTSAVDMIKTKGGPIRMEFSPLGFEMKNSPLTALTVRMEVQFMQNSPYPIVDGTNYNDPVDLKIDAKLSDLTELNKSLSKYDLKFEVDDYITDVLIIEDKQKSTKTN
ncbi:TlpA disulfide reductase family protein [Pedobacter gandavensis]|uniref:TlpA family protein disulfide reductase n=1 Tax=Pedobacter gandavensis TaxID=2679963 RepID=UPI002930B9A6|nr:TlpA disulfide reductase family protein [Pedobacter gandavensis]